MESIPWFVSLILSVEALAVVVVIVLLVYLLVRRLKIKKEETFEKREN